MSKVIKRYSFLTKFTDEIFTVLTKILWILLYLLFCSYWSDMWLIFWVRAHGVDDNKEENCIFGIALTGKIFQNTWMQWKFAISTQTVCFLPWFRKKIEKSVKFCIPQNTEIFTNSMLKNFGNLLNQPYDKVIGSVQKINSSMILPILNLTSAAFLYMEKTWVSQRNHKGLIRKLQKIASDITTVFIHCPWNWTRDHSTKCQITDPLNNNTLYYILGILWQI